MHVITYILLKPNNFFYWINKFINFKNKMKKNESQKNYVCAHRSKRYIDL